MLTKKADQNPECPGPTDGGEIVSARKSYSLKQSKSYQSLIMYKSDCLSLLNIVLSNQESKA